MGMSADKISRRDFGARSLAGSALTFLASRPAMPTSTGPAAESKVSKPRMISTMTGLVRCDSLGLTLMHEHIFGGNGPGSEADIQSASVEFAVGLFEEAERVGVNSIVELTPFRPVNLFE